MNCDLVFEILTRGPFPSGEPTDASVELHLSRCHDCRRLAEALRPAVELFHETMFAEEEADSLPGYYGAVGEAESGPATAVAFPSLWSEPLPNNETNSKLENPRRRLAACFGQWAGALALGMAICVAAAAMVVQFKPGEHTEAVAASHDRAASAAAPADGDARTLLESLQLPLACLNPHRDAAPSPDATAGLLCCTQCHNAAQPRAPKVSAVALLQREACTACHQME